MAKTLQLQDAYCQLIGKLGAARDITIPQNSARWSTLTTFFDRSMLRLEDWADDIDYETGSLQSVNHQEGLAQLLKTHFNTLSQAYDRLLKSYLLEKYNGVKDNRKLLQDECKDKFNALIDFVDPILAVHALVAKRGSYAAVAGTIKSLAVQNREDSSIAADDRLSKAENLFKKIVDSFASFREPQISNTNLFGCENDSYGPDNFLESVYDTITSQNERSKAVILAVFESLKQFGRAIETVFGSDPISRSAKVDPISHMWRVFGTLAVNVDGTTKSNDTALSILEMALDMLPKTLHYAEICVLDREKLLRWPVTEQFLRLISFATQACHALQFSTTPSGRDSSVGIMGMKEILIEAKKAKDEIHGLLEMLWSQFDDETRNSIESEAAQRNALNLDFKISSDDEATSEPEILEEDLTKSAKVSFIDPKSVRFNDAPKNLSTRHFFGREGDLKRVDKALDPLSPYKHTRCVVYGERGIGKTNLVLKYAMGVAEKVKNFNVFWVSAATSDKLLKGFDYILELLQDEARAHSDYKARMFAVKRALEAFSRKSETSWILVVDDVRDESVDFLRDYLPGLDPRGLTIFTTRFKEIADRLNWDGHAPIVKIELEKLSTEDAAEVLLSNANVSKRARTYSTITKAMKIAETVDNLPLAVEGVGALLKRSTDVTLADLLEMCKMAVTAETAKIGSGTKKSYVIAETIRSTIGELDKKSPSARRVLDILAFFDPESIPLGMLLGNRPWSDVSSETFPESGFESYPTPRDPVMDQLFDPETRQDLIDQLLSASLIGFRSDWDNLSLRMHDFVRETILSEARTKGDIEHCFEQAVALLVGSFERIGDSLDKPKTWRHCSMLTPHFQSLVRCCSENKFSSPPLVQAYARLGWYFYSSGCYRNAEHSCKWAIERLSPTESRPHRERLARVHMKLDEFDKAEEVFLGLLEADDVSEVDLSDHNLREAEGLASSYYSQGRLKDAELLYSRILVAKTEISEDEDYEKTKILEGLANTFQRLGRPHDAEDLYRRCLIFRKKDLGSRYRSLLESQYNWARLLRDQGRLDEAEKMFEDLLEDYKDTVGDDHPDALLAAARLAYTYAKLKKYEKAEYLAAETLQKQRAYKYPQEVAICYTLRVLGDIFAHTRRYEKAAHCFEEALAGYQKRLGPNHLFTLYLRRNYSDMYYRQGSLAEAVKILEDAGPNIYEPPIGAKLARLYDHQKRYAEAEALAKATYELHKERAGSYTVETNYTMWVLARIYKNLGKTKEAENHYSHAWKGYKRLEAAVFGAPMRLAEEFAGLYRGMGQLAKAQEIMDEAKAKYIKEETMDPDPEPPLTSFDEGYFEDYFEKPVDSMIQSRASLASLRMW